MTATTAPHHDDVHVAVTLTSAGAGSLSMGGAVRPVRGVDLDDARDRVKRVVAARAAELNRPLTMTCTDPTGEWTGIIPARAGFTRRPCSCSRLMQDHPRSRGVYRVDRPLRAGRLGSSPLARGLRGEDRPGVLDQRIIPARAGFTYLHAHQPHCLPDHPRSRGVYLGAFHECVAETGSSPLARGLPPVVGDACDRPGIIPARAGFT